MAPMSIVIKDLLVAEGIAPFGANPADKDAWFINIGSDNFDYPNVITLSDIAGEPSNPKFLLDYPRFSMTVRGADYVAAWEKAEAIRDLILGFPSQTIGGVRYVGIYDVNGLFHVKSDDRSRPIFMSNFRTIVEPASGTHRVSL